MKNYFGLIILLVLVAGCAPSQIGPLPTPSLVLPTVTMTPTSTATLTVTPSPTLSLPVAYQTPIPDSDTQITSENIKNLREVARYYGEMEFTAALTNDNNLLFVRDPVGVDIYAYQTGKHLNHIDLPSVSRYIYFSDNPRMDLQVSANGEWALVDQQWLIHNALDKEPQLRDLVSEFGLQKAYSRQAALSLDGSKLVISEGPCFESCLGFFKIISLIDNKVLYSWDDDSYKQMHGYDPVLSSDGLLVITRVDTQIILWRVQDGTQAASIKNIQGASRVVLSSDSSLIAIGQIDTVQIWDMASGQKTQTISGLCGELYKPPQPVSVDNRKIVILECRADTGKVSIWTITDTVAVYEKKLGPTTASRIVFEEDKDRVTLLKNPRKTGPWIFPRVPYTIQFLKNDDLVFVQLGDQLRNVACVISANGRARCSEYVTLGTDEQFYAYTWRDDCVEFYSGFVISGNPVYSVCWKGWYVNGFDPINGLLFYTAPSSGGNANLSNSVVIGLENNQLKIGEWKGSEIQTVVFSGDRKFAAVCRRPGGAIYFQRVNADKLMLIDLVQKKVVIQEPFTCLGTPMILSMNGSKLVSAYGYTGVVNGQSLKKHQLIVMNTVPPIKKEIIDIDCDLLNALTFSPDESIFVVACNDRTLRFLNSETFSEIHRLTNFDPDIWGLAFSKDGTMLAIASKRGYISIWAVPPFDYNPSYQIYPSPSPETNPYIWDFEADGNTEGWGAWNQLSPLKTSNGHITTESTGNDPYMGSPMITADAAALSHIEIRMRVSGGDIAEIYFITNSDGTYDESKVMRFPIMGDGEFHTYTLDMSKVKKWGGVITQIRLDPTVTQATIEIDYIQLTEP